MAEIHVYEYNEEFWDKFIRVEGTRGVVLVFNDINEPEAMALAEDIAKIIDTDGDLRRLLERLRDYLTSVVDTNTNWDAWELREKINRILKHKDSD